MRAGSRAIPPTFDEYLLALPAPQREALEDLRVLIHRAAPGAEECVSYQLPAFRLNGKMLCAMGATRKHCALYLMSNTVAAGFTDELAAYDTGTGTVRFQPDDPLPDTLVLRLVEARIAENAR
ncbi:MAG: DUF1801 domain-containing protein [Rhodothermales bacterium]